MANFATILEAKRRLKIDQADTSDDAELGGIMAAATAMLIEFMGRDPRLQDFEDTLSGRGTAVLPVRQFPIVSVDSVTVGNQVLTTDQYSFSDYCIMGQGVSFPVGTKNIVVAYSAGLDPAPATLKEAYLMTVKALWLAKDTNPNATGESWAGVSSESWYGTGAGAVPPAARGMLASLIRQIVVP